MTGRRGTSGGAQLELTLEQRTPEALLAELRQLGLRGIDRCRLTRNRCTMVSFRGPELRVHEAFASAPTDVLRAIVVFVTGRGIARRRARRIILDHPVPRVDAPLRRERPHPADAALARELRQWHHRLNQERFGGILAAIPVRVSRRMTSRLGHYRAPHESDPGEIVLARRHLVRDGWDEILETLLHEMVHQWQYETGRPVDHGAAFRRKARELGITPSATRPPRKKLKTGRRGDIFPPCVA